MASGGDDDTINPFTDPIARPQHGQSQPGAGDTLHVGRDASLTLGEDSLVVLDEGLSQLQKSRCCGLLPPKKSTPTRAFPYFNILWAELSDFELTIHHASPVSNPSTIRVSFINYIISKDNLSTAKTWVESLLSRAYGPSQRRKRIKVLVNPFGGSGSAPKWYRRDIEPILIAAQCHIDVERTAYSGHAREIAANLDVDAWDVVASCSGDGLPHEVFNGLGDKENATEALRKVAVVQLPCGTGNAMCWNLNGTDSPSLAALCTVKGIRTPLDLVSVTQGRPERRTLSFLSQSVGIVAETDLGTEHLRWMGDARFTYGFLVRLLGKTVYPCSISVKVIDDNKASIRADFQASRRKTSNEPTSNIQDGNNRNISTQSTEPGADAVSTKNPEPADNITSLEPEIRQQNVHTKSIGLPALEFGTINTPLPASWPPLQPHPTLGNFYCGNMGYMSRDANFFQAARPGDGCLDLVCIDGNLPRLTAVRSLVAVGNGAFFDMPYVSYRKIAGYRIVPYGCAGADEALAVAGPGSSAASSAAAEAREDLHSQSHGRDGWAGTQDGKPKQGYISIDGERVPFEPFQVEVHPGLGTVLSRRGGVGYETPDLP